MSEEDGRLENLVGELAKRALALLEGSLAVPGGAVDAAGAARDDGALGAEQSFALQSVQGRIQRPWADPVAMAGELVAEPGSMHTGFAGVMEDVQLDGAAQEAVA